MVIIISYNKQTWNEYNDSQTADENLANGAIISADRLNNMETGISNNDTNKVTDNKNGTEQLNGVQVQPYNKLSDNVGGRNLLPISSYSSGYVSGTHGSVTSAGQTTKEVISDFVPVDITQSYYCQIIQQVNNNPAWCGIGFYDNNEQFISRFGTGYTWVTGTITSVIRILPFGSPNISIPNVTTTTFPQNTAYVRVSFRTYGAPFQASLEKTSTLNDWTPAPEDKVNVSDMRKPASDVAGIEEVSTLQTQVDNSAVGTNLITNSNFSSGLNHWRINPGTNSDSKAVVTTDSDGDTCVHITGTGKDCGLWTVPVSFDQNQVTTGSVVAKGTGTLRLVGFEGRPASNFGTISTESYSKVSSIVQAASSTNNFSVYFGPVNGVVDVYIKLAKLEVGSHATDWCPNPSEILTKADDSTVAHLSGANNFDTVPTYGTNNKPFAINDTGATTARPTGQAVGYQYFDTTLNKPIWYNGANWVDSTGTTV